MTRRLLAFTLCALLLCAICHAEEAPFAPVRTPDVEAADGHELSAYYGKDIALAAEALGGLTFSAGEEFRENYIGDAVALRGEDGVITYIELRDAPGDYTLCGISVGMAREDALALMEGYPKLWDYDEEVAWIVRADAQNELNDETLVVFFDEDGRVNGAWYRVSAA